MDLLSGEISLITIANLAIALSLVVGTILSVVYIIKGGFSFVVSAGDDEKIKAAVHTIRYAIVGLIVIFLALLIIKILGAFFGFNFLSYLSYEKVHEMAVEIIQRVTTTDDAVQSLNGILD